MGDLCVGISKSMQREHTHLQLHTNRVASGGQRWVGLRVLNCVVPLNKKRGQVGVAVHTKVIKIIQVPIHILRPKIS